MRAIHVARERLRVAAGPAFQDEATADATAEPADVRRQVTTSPS
jgi:hypothetical protein